MADQRSFRRTGLVAACGAALVVLAAGCGSSDTAGGYGSAAQSAAPLSSAPLSSGPPSTAPEGPSPAPSSEDSSGAPVSQGTGTTVTATEKDFSFELSQQAFPAGTYTFVTPNEGQFPHALKIEGNGIAEVQTSVVQPGGTTKLTVALKKGVYELYCPVDGHKDKGMQLKLRVT